MYRHFMQIILLKSLVRKSKQVWVMAQEEVKNQGMSTNFLMFNLDLP